MKISIFTPLYPPLSGGAAQYYKLLVDELQYYSVVEKLYIVTELVPKEKIIRSKNKVLIFSILPPKRSFPDFLPLSILMFILRNVEILVLAIYLRFFRNSDIIHIHSSFLKIRRNVDNFFLKKTLFLIGKKLIVDCRDLGSIPSTTENIDGVICCAENIYQRVLKRKYVERYKVIHIPIPFLSVKPTFTKEKERFQPYLLFLGDIHYRKGVYALIKAFNVLSLEYPELNLVFIGKNLSGKKFLTEIEKDSRIFFLGVRKHRIALSFIVGSEMLILPSHSEGMPRVALESSMLKQKMVLPPGIPELERCCSEFVLDEISSWAIALKIEELINKECYLKYSLKTHNPQNIAKKTLDFYTKVLKEERI